MTPTEVDELKERLLGMEPQIERLTFRIPGTSEETK